MVDHAGYKWWRRKQQEQDIKYLKTLWKGPLVNSNLKVYGSVIDPLEVYEVYVTKTHQQLFILVRYFTVKLIKSMWIGSAELSEEDLEEIIANLDRMRREIQNVSVGLEILVKGKEEGGKKKILVTNEMVRRYEEYRLGHIETAKEVALRILDDEQVGTKEDLKRVKSAVKIIGDARLVYNDIVEDINSITRENSEQKFEGKPRVMERITEEDLLLDRLNVY
jgi:hypothetical protein